jgi:hypothetical protein
MGEFSNGFDLVFSSTIEESTCKPLLIKGYRADLVFSPPKQELRQKYQKIGDFHADLVLQGMPGDCLALGRNPQGFQPQT